MFELTNLDAIQFRTGKPVFIIKIDVRYFKLIVRDTESQFLPRFCSPMVEADVGDSWRARDPLGRTIRNELVAGRR